MIEHSIDVRREDALISIVHLDGRISPPQEGLRHVGTVVHAALDFQVGAAGAQGETSHTLLVEHLLHLAHPHADAAIGILLDAGINGHEGGRTVVLWPVELDATTDPRTRQSHEGRLDDVVVIDEVALGYLVISHLYATTQLRQYHHLDVLVLNPDGQIVLVHLLVAHRFDDGVGIDYTT